MRVGITKSSKVAQAKTGWARIFQLNAPRDDWIPIRYSMMLHACIYYVYVLLCFMDYGYDGIVSV